MNTTVGNLLAERIELGRALCRTIKAQDKTAEAAASRLIDDCLARLDPALHDVHLDAEFVQALNALFTVHHTRYYGTDGPVVAKREDALLAKLDVLAARRAATSDPSTGRSARPSAAPSRSHAARLRTPQPATG